MSVERVNDARLRSLPGYNLRRAYAHVVNLHREGWMREFKIGIFDYAILILIDANPGIRSTQLCEALGIAKPNMVTFIDKLAKRGWVTRTRSERDARVQELRLTIPGQTVAQTIEKSAHATEHAALRGLGAQGLAALSHTLQRVHGVST